MRSFRYHRGPMAGAEVRAWFPSRRQDATGASIAYAEANRLLHAGLGFYSRKQWETTYYWTSMEGWVYPDWWPSPDGGTT